MIDLLSSDFDVLTLRTPQQYNGLDVPATLYRTAPASPTQYILDNTLSRFVLETDDMGGVHLKEFFLQPGGYVWTNKEPSLWRVLVFRPNLADPNDDSGTLFLEPEKAYFSTTGVQAITDGKRIVLNWNNRRVGADTLSVSVTLTLKDGEYQLRANITATWSGTPTQFAVDSLCVLPLRILPYPQAAVPQTDYALVPALFGSVVRGPTVNMPYNMDPYGPTNLKALYQGSVRCSFYYPNGAGFGLGVWGYYDSVAKEAWSIHLENHSQEYVRQTFQGNWHHLVSEMYVPQENHVTVGNGGSTLDVGYDLCLRPMKLVSQHGWMELGQFYRSRLTATNPYFSVPAWADRTDRDATWRSPHIFLLSLINNLATVAAKQDDPTIVLNAAASLRGALGASSSVPIMGHGTFSSLENMAQAYEQRTKPASLSDRAIVLAQAQKVYLGAHHAGPWFPDPWEHRQYKASLNWWEENDGIGWLRVSRHGKLRGEGDDDREQNPVYGYYRERTYTIVNYNNDTLTVTVAETITAGEWAVNDVVVLERASTTQLRLARAFLAAVPGTNTLKLKAHPLDALGNSSIPSPGDQVHVWPAGQPRECPHLLVYGAPQVLQELIEATWGGNYDLHRWLVFYADVYTRVGGGRTEDVFTCSGEHPDWQPKVSSYLPHPEGGGSWWLQAVAEMFRQHRSYVLTKHKALTGGDYLWTFCEFSDEGMLPHLDGTYHVTSCMGLFRALTFGEKQDSDGSTLPDQALGNYRMVPLMAVVHPGRQLSLGSPTVFSNGLLTQNLGRGSSTAEQRLRNATGMWLGLEWPWGMTPATFGLFSYPDLAADAVDIDVFDETHWSSSHPWGAAHQEVRDLREFWKALAMAELRWARRFLGNGEPQLPATLNPATTRLDLVAEGVWDIVRFTLTQAGGAIIDKRPSATGHGFTGPFLEDENNAPHISHAIWKDLDTNQVVIFLVNYTRYSGTWNGTVTFANIGLPINQAIRAFQLTPEGYSGLIGDYPGPNATFQVTLPKWSMTAILLTPTTNTYAVPVQPSNFKVQPTLTEGELQVSWGPPIIPPEAGTKFTYPSVKEYIVMRSQLRYPLTILEGLQVFRGTGTSFLDKGLHPGVPYYYACFIDSGETTTVT